MQKTNACTLLSIWIGEKCRIILIRLDSRANAKREIFGQVFSFFFLFKLDWKEAIVRYFMYYLSLLMLELTEYGI